MGQPRCPLNRPTRCGFTSCVGLGHRTSRHLLGRATTTGNTVHGSLREGEESARLCGRGFIDLLPDEVNRKSRFVQASWNIGKFRRSPAKRHRPKRSGGDQSASRRASAGTSEAGSRRRRKRVCRDVQQFLDVAQLALQRPPLPARWPNSLSARVRRRSPSVMAAFGPWRNTLCGWVGGVPVARGM